MDLLLEGEGANVHISSLYRVELNVLWLMAANDGLDAEAVVRKLLPLFCLVALRKEPTSRSPGGLRRAPST